MSSVVSTASHNMDAWQKHLLSFHVTWPLVLCVPWLLEGFLLNCKLHSILMPLHMEYDSSNRSGVDRSICM